ncbi:hypothetical protein D9M71_151850 [compost metagenome]
MVRNNTLSVSTDTNDVSASGALTLTLYGNVEAARGWHRPEPLSFCPHPGSVRYAATSRYRHKPRPVVRRGPGHCRYQGRPTARGAPPDGPRRVDAASAGGPAATLRGDPGAGRLWQDQHLAGLATGADGPEFRCGLAIARRRRQRTATLLPLPAGEPCGNRPATGARCLLPARPRQRRNGCRALGHHPGAKHQPAFARAGADAR